MITRFFVEYKNNLYPIIKIEKDKDVGIYFINSKGAHLTLHKDAKQILLTYWDPEKPLSIWDKEKKKYR